MQALVLTQHVCTLPADSLVILHSMGSSHSKKRSAAASSRSWFSLLADVEIQSVMRCLALKDLLAFARCSTQLLAAASSDFACANALLTTFTPQENLDSISGRVLDHCPLSVMWLKDPRRAHLLQVSGCTADIDRIRAGRIVRFDASSVRAIPPEEWIAVLQCPAMQSVRCLIMHKSHFSSIVTEEIVNLLSTLQHLHTLHIAANPGDPDRFVSLPAFPALTDLSISDNNAAGVSCLSYVTECSRLRKLSVYSPALYSDIWNGFWSSPSHMRDLEELRIESYEAQEVGTTSLDYSLLRGTKLKRLGLKECRHIDFLLPHLPSISGLELVEIEPCFLPRHKRSHQAPSLDVLRSLLRSAPTLIVRLVIQEGAQRHAKEFAEVVDEFVGRFQISTNNWDASAAGGGD